MLVLPKYRPAVSGFTAGVCRALTVQLGLPELQPNFQGPPLPLYESLSRAGLGQADVVLCLLRLGLVPEAEALVGHAIIRLPYWRPRQPPPQPRAPLGPDDRRILHVDRNPRLPTTPAFQRYRLLRPGATLRGVISRGVTRKDIRQALAAGWISLEVLSC